jgi:signal peptidase II
VDLLLRLHRYRLLLGLSFVVFALDQVTKVLVDRRFPLSVYYPGEHITVVPGFFRIIHVGNTGAAWGMFEGKSFWLAVLALVALAAIWFFRRHLELAERPVQISFGLLIGGILGNLVDRLVHGHVIDFLDFHYGDFVWPTFNLADAAITIGVFLYLIHSFRQPVRTG